MLPSAPGTTSETASNAEQARGRALNSYRILDTLPEAVYDDIVQLASQICATPIALISLSDSQRQWFKARAGLDVAEIPRHAGFCDHALRTPDQLMEVADATRDARFVNHPLVTQAPHFRFYAGMPLVTPGGEAIGTLCVIDLESRTLNEQQRAALAALTRVTMALLETRRRELGNARQLADRDFVVRAKPATSAPAPAPFTGQRFAVAIVELDHFAAIDQHRGAAAGADALQRVAQALEENVDAADVISRHGEQEFLVVLADAGQAEKRMERVRQRIADSAGPFAISVSIGLAVDRSGGLAMEQVFELADEALQQARRRGRDRVVLLETDA